MSQPPTSQSLLEPAKTQAAAAPFLFVDFDDEECYQALERHGEFTGERLFSCRPKVYALVIRMLAEGLSTRQISRACGVSQNTVEAVRRREGVSIEAEKEQLLGIVRIGARLCAERVLELVPSMSARDAAIAFGILSEKMLLLSGDPTVIVGKSDLVSHEDFNRLLEALPAADAQVIGSSACPVEQTAPPSPSSPPPAVVDGDPQGPPAVPEAPESDEPSDAFLCEEARGNEQGHGRDLGGLGNDRRGGGHPIAAPPVPPTNS